VQYLMYWGWDGVWWLCKSCWQLRLWTDCLVCGGDFGQREEYWGGGDSGCWGATGHGMRYITEDQGGGGQPCSYVHVWQTQAADWPVTPSLRAFLLCCDTLSAAPPALQTTPPPPPRRARWCSGHGPAIRWLVYHRSAAGRPPAVWA
jgi:hypothetical protein